jgi:hypothetical protein
MAPKGFNYREAREALAGLLGSGREKPSTEESLGHGGAVNETRPNSPDRAGPGAPVSAALRETTPGEQQPQERAAP